MTNWVVPNSDDLKNTFGSIFVEQDNGDDFDPESAADAWLPIIVAEVRGYILRGGRSPLSKTPGSVPPEAKIHVLALTAEAIIVNTPRLAGYVVIEGDNGPMSRMIVAARKFLQELQAGVNPVPPNDPDPATVPFGVQWGDTGGEGDENTTITDLKMDAPPT